MISNKHLREEIVALEALCDGNTKDLDKAILKSNILIIKLLHNIRTNQVVAMTANDIALVPSKRTADDDEF